MQLRWRYPVLFLCTCAMLCSLTIPTWAKETVPDARSADVTPSFQAATQAKVPPRRRVIPPRSSTAQTSAMGEALYKSLQTLKPAIKTKLFAVLQKTALQVAWKSAKDETFVGNLRPVKGGKGMPLYLLRRRTGQIYVLALPADAKLLEKGSKSPYAALAGKVKFKMNFVTQLAAGVVDGQTYIFAKLVKEPKRLLLDRLFFIFIILLLFLTMVGMGLSLTTGDFARIAQKPRGMIVGPLCQFILLPLLAFGIGRLFGFHESHPFIFVGLLLVCSNPGGVTSNLMTYLGKGDVALSVSLTAFSTVISLFATPLLLGFYASSIPSVSLPIGDVAKQILVLVLVPLTIGMVLRSRAENFAKRAEGFFAGLGVFALLFLIIVGVLANLDQFANTERYGLLFYGAIFCLTVAGMLFGGVIAKLMGLENSQVRAISLETGLQNSSLAMTLAILLQDRVGDFYSAMFFTSGVFGLTMYVTGALAIFSFPRILPVTEPPQS